MKQQYLLLLVLLMSLQIQHCIAVMKTMLLGYIPKEILVFGARSSDLLYRNEYGFKEFKIYESIKSSLYHFFYCLNFLK